ncbi:ROK family protein [Citricoccus sp. SGAir0253]|nr:ROK family protein [Citricoccus sp. SGAir0253]
MASTTTDPATGLHTALGIDIGGTGMKGGVVQLGEGPGTGQLVGKRFRIPTPQPAVPGAVAGVLAEITAELDARPEAPPATLPVGVCFPAVIQGGTCRTATNIDPSWIGTDVDALFSEHLGRPVTTLNDADAAGLAEVRFGAGRGVSGTVLVITLGTGIGAGLFRDGELVPNLELGTIELDGAIAEQRASAAARERDGLDWPEYAERLQRYFSYVERIFYPDLFIVGGGISKRPQDYLPRLSLRTPIVPATLQNNAGIVGAALWATDVLAAAPTRQAVLHTARHAADQEMARQAEADERGGAPGAGGDPAGTTAAGPAERASRLRRKAVKAGQRAAKAEKRADKAEKAAAKAERKAAREAKAVHKAMEKAIRRSSR